MLGYLDAAAHRDHAIHRVDARNYPSGVLAACLGQYVRVLCYNCSQDHTVDPEPQEAFDGVQVSYAAPKLELHINGLADVPYRIQVLLLAREGAVQVNEVDKLRTRVHPFLCSGSRVVRVHGHVFGPALGEPYAFPVLQVYGRDYTHQII